MGALFSEAPCDRRQFLFYYQAQEQITQMVFRPVNIPHIIDHGKKHGLSRFRSQTFKDWPCDLLMVMANARRIGN